MMFGILVSTSLGKLVYYVNKRLRSKIFDLGSLLFVVCTLNFALCTLNLDLLSHAFGPEGPANYYLLLLDFIGETEEWLRDRDTHVQKHWPKRVLGFLGALVLEPWRYSVYLGLIGLLVYLAYLAYLVYWVTLTRALYLSKHPGTPRCDQNRRSH